MTKPNGYTNSWPQRVVNFHIWAEGLNNANPRTFTRRVHYVLSIGIFICLCQEVVLTVVRFNQNLTFGERIIPIYYVSLCSTCLIEFYCLTRPRMTKCVQNSNVRLHCLSYIDENLIWKRHLPFFKLSILSIVGTLYMSGFTLTILFPLLKFGTESEQTLYVVYDNWYPFDVFSSSWLYWAEFFYETVLVWYTVYLESAICTLFLYTTLAARVRAEALGQFFEIVCSESRVRSAPVEGPNFSISVCSRMRATTSKNWRSSAITPLEDDVYNVTREMESGPSHGIGTQANTVSRYVDAKYGSKDIFNANKLKEGINDWNTIWRQAKLIGATFILYLSMAHFNASMSFVLTTLSTIHEMHNIDKNAVNAVTAGLMYANFVVITFAEIYFFSYYATLLQDSNTDLLISLEMGNWPKGNLEFKKLLLQFKSALYRPIKLKLYTFYPINLATFREHLDRSWGFFLCLYRLTTPK